MLLIDDLLVSQEYVGAKKIKEMHEFVANGGIWTAEVLLNHDRHQTVTKHGREGFPSPLIAITRFEDGTHLIHNGHHRIRATRDVRQYLYDEEYIISDRPLVEYLQINLPQTFVTPYDPRTHIRLYDFHDYKKHVLDMARVDSQKAIDYVLTHPHLYRKDRNVFKVMEMKIIEDARTNL